MYTHLTRAILKYVFLFFRRIASSFTWRQQVLRPRTQNDTYRRKKDNIFLLHGPDGRARTIGNAKSDSVKRVERSAYVKRSRVGPTSRLAKISLNVGPDPRTRDPGVLKKSKIPNRMARDFLTTKAAVDDGRTKSWNRFGRSGVHDTFARLRNRTYVPSPPPGRGQNLERPRSTGRR